MAQEWAVDSPPRSSLLSDLTRVPHPSLSTRLARYDPAAPDPPDPTALTGLAASPDWCGGDSWGHVPEFDGKKWCTYGG